MLINDEDPLLVNLLEEFAPKKKEERKKPCSSNLQVWLVSYTYYQHKQVSIYIPRFRTYPITLVYTLSQAKHWGGGFRV
jgi:hypothetical protein